MSKIEIDIDSVRNCSANINSSMKNIHNITIDIKNIRQNLYSKVTYNYEITTQYNRVKNNLSNTETKIKNLKNFLDSSLEDYSECESKIKKLYLHSYTLNPKVHILNPKDIAKEIPLSASLVKDLYDQRLIFNGVEYKFKIDKKNGTVSLIVKNPEQFLDKSVNSLKKNEFKDIFNDRKVNKQFVNQLMNDSVVLYDSGYTKNANKILGSTALHDQLNVAVSKSNSNWINFAGTDEFKNSFSTESLGKAAQKELTDRIEYFDVKDWKKVIDNKDFMKGLGKSAGIAGDFITVGSNFNENFYNQETGELEFNGQNIQEFTVDTAIDFGTGAATAYVGGAVGSLFFPPIGTIIGVGVGVVADCIINTPFGESGKSVVDHLKDGTNWAVDKLQDAGNWLGDKVQDGMKYLGSIFW